MYKLLLDAIIDKLKNLDVTDTIVMLETVRKCLDGVGNYYHEDIIKAALVGNPEPEQKAEAAE